MANGDIHDNISDQYLQQFDRSVGISGMQKLQQFSELQLLGYNGQLGLLKQDFHGLRDFQQQLSLYSSTHPILIRAWSLIKHIVPNNINIARQLVTIPGLGTVGRIFLSIHNFSQVFSISPGDLTSPSAVADKASIYRNQSIQANVVSNNPVAELVGGGAGLSPPNNANQLNGIPIIGTPSLTTPFLQYNSVSQNLQWVVAPASGSGSGSGTSSSVSVNGTIVSNPNFIDGLDARFHVAGSNITISIDGGSF